MTDPSPTVSIVVVTYNSQPVLTSFISSLLEAAEGLAAKFIFVDNASTDRSVPLIKELLPTSEIIQNSVNHGFGRAVNQGTRLAQSEWVLMLNPDLELEPDSIRVLIARAGQHDDLGLATGRITFPDGTFQSVCRNLPTLTNLIFSRGFFLSRLTGQTRSYTLGELKEETAVPALSGAVMLIRRSVWEELGGFDERFFMFMEDTDLSRRATKAGLTNWFIPVATAIHEWGRSSSVSRQRRRYLHHLSMWHYFRKYYSFALAYSIVPCFLMLNFFLGMLVSDKRPN